MVSATLADTNLQVLGTLCDETRCVTSDSLFVCVPFFSSTSGNVLVYPPGNWYGRVTPCHVQALLLTDVQGGGRLDVLYRGGL